MISIANESIETLRTKAWFEEIRAQKARVPLQITIKAYQDKIIDRLVKDAYYFLDKELVSTTLYNWINLQNDELYKKIMRSPYLDKNKLIRDGFLDNKKQVTNKMTTETLIRFDKNLSVVDDVLAQADVDIKTYQNIINRMPSVNRFNALKLSVDKGYNLETGERFKDIDKTIEGLQKYSEKRSEFDKVQAINEENTLYITKTWLWSQLEITRHEDMDGETVPVDEPFEVVNSQNGDTDYLMFPRDIENDSNNCSNICSCECGISYNTER